MSSVDLENKIKDLDLELSILKSSKIAEARQNEILFRLAIENSSQCGISVIDDAGKQVYVNQSFCNMLGWNEYELLHKYPPFKYYPPNEIDKINNAFRTAIICQAPDEGFYLEYCHKSGNLIPVKVKIMPFIQDNNRTFWLTNVADISLQKQNEMAKQQLQKFVKELNAINIDKDRFITILAHDLRCPFNTILGFLELLTENLHIYSMDDIREKIKTVYETTKHTYNLLEDILLWINVQAGKLPFDPQKINFAEICECIVETLKPNAQVKNTTINHFAANNINLYADVDMFKTVLRNLVSNAIKFTNTGGRINIYAEQNQETATITVADNGIGIKPESLNRLFNIAQFFTTKGTADEKGSGLGLLLCKEFIEKHDGKIWVESKVGKGSNFKFTLPLFNDEINSTN